MVDPAGLSVGRDPAGLTSVGRRRLGAALLLAIFILQSQAGGAAQVEPCGTCVEGRCAVEGRLELSRRPYVVIDHDINSSFVQLDLRLRLNGDYGEPDDFDLEGWRYRLYELGNEKVQVPHQLIEARHRHKLRKKPGTTLSVVARIDREVTANLTHLVFQFMSMSHRRCEKPLLLNAQVAIKLNEEAPEARAKTRRLVENRVEPAPTIDAKAVAQADNSTASQLQTLLSPAFLTCDIPFSISYTMQSDAQGSAVIDVQANFTSLHVDVAVYTLFHAFCEECGGCELNVSDADAVSYCAKGANIHDCHSPKHHIFIRHPLSKLSCLGFALCAVSPSAELDPYGALVSADENLHMPATRIIAIEPPHRSLGHTMRTYIGYGILLTILFIFTFFSALSRCRYGPETTKLLGDRDGWEIDECDVQVCKDKQLSYGEHASVYLGILTTTEASVHDRARLAGSYQKCAIKVLHQEAPICERRRFLYEIRVHKILGIHPRVVEMIGAVTMTEPKCLVLHYYPNGNLLGFMRERGSYMLRMRALGIDVESCSSVDLDNFIAVQDLFRWAIEIAAGMEYVASRGIVHRNVCARNVYVDENRGIRIGGFDCARPESCDESGFRHASLSIKWMAPESLRYLAFSPASDVWSFGVVLYEVFTLGAPPYPFIHPSLIHSYLLKGNRLPRPTQCSLQMYALMTSCWRYVATQRPSFTQLRNTLHALAAQDAEDPATPFYVKVDSSDIFDAGPTEEEQKNLSIIMEDEESAALTDRTCSDHY